MPGVSEPVVDRVHEPLLGGAGATAIAGYLLVLVLIGLAGRFARKENTLGDFFLAGRGLGLAVLLLTLYATQYSGNTLIGLSANAYRSGFGFLVSVFFMVGVIGVYVIYAPRLHRLSVRKGFITLSDYIQDRYDSRALSVLISLSGIIALGNFLVTNLKAAGEIVFQVTGGGVPHAHGIAGLAVIILIYETLGGLRSVAWTDVVQGILLFLGCTTVFVATLAGVGGLEGAAQRLYEARPDFWSPPDAETCLTWVSTVVIVSFGAGLYPHAIQRIYAAGSERALKRSLQIMVFMPFVTTLFMISIGILGNISHPGLSGDLSEGITLLVLKDFALSHPAAVWVVVLFAGAVFAAIMSSADSALLSMSSSVTQDIARPLSGIEDQRRLTRLGKLISTVVMGLCVTLAIMLPQSIWQLIEIKAELLAQTAPALLLGLHWTRLRTLPVLAGFLAGTGVTLGLIVGNFFLPETVAHRPFGIHAGVIGLVVNVALVASLQRAGAKTGPAIR